MNWNDVRKWLVGRPSEAVVRIGEPGAVEGLYVRVPLGDARRDTPATATLSDRFGPETVREVVDFAGRKGLPVDGWFVDGIDRLPWRYERVARWIASLARGARRGVVAVGDAGLAQDEVDRLAGHLRRHCRRVERPDATDPAA